jgi:hypothetical protein
MTKKSRWLKVSLGLAVRMVRLMAPHVLAHHHGCTCVREVDMVNSLVHVLVWYNNSSIKVPREV